MTLKEFIKKNKQEIDNCIRKATPNFRINDEERRMWILNDESLYNWAKAEGVKI